MPPIDQLTPFDIVRAALLAIATLFPIINPIGSAAIYLDMMHGYTQQTQREMARKIGINSFLLMMGAVLVGTYVLDFFGVSLPAVQVGGGSVLIAAAWNLLRRNDEQATQAAMPDPTRILSQAFYPFTLPITVGPGSISVAVTLGATLPQKMDQRSLLSPFLIIGLTLGIAIMSLIVFWMYASAERLGRMIGPTATSVVMRLSSFILLCIGVQIAWNGLSALIAPLLKR